MRYRVDYSWIVLLLLFLSQTVMAIGAYAWGPLGPYLITSLSISRTQVGMLTSSLYLVATIIAGPVGILIDKFGSKVMLISCLSIMLFGFMAISRVGSFFLVLFFSGFAGLGYGMINQIAVKDLSACFRETMRGLVMGIRQTGVTVGAAVASLILPFFAERNNWQFSTLIIAYLICAVLLMVILWYKKKNVNKYIPIVKGTDKGHLTFWATVKQPEIFIYLAVVPFLAGSQAIISTFFILFLREEIYGTAVFLGPFLSMVMIAGTAGRICWGIVSDRLFSGNRIKVMIIICLTALFGILGLLSLWEGAPLGFGYLISLLLGLGFFGFHGVLFAAIADLVPYDYAASVTGIIISLSWAGMVLFPILFGVMADTWGYFFSWLIVLFSAILSSAVCTFFYLKSFSVKREGPC